MDGRMTGYMADRHKGGRVRQPQKIPPICREGVGTSTVVEERKRGGGADRRRQVNSRSLRCTQVRMGCRRLLPGWPSTPNFQVIPDTQVD